MTWVALGVLCALLLVLVIALFMPGAPLLGDDSSTSQKGK